MGGDIGSWAMSKGAPLGENSQGELEPAGPGDNGRGPTRPRSPRGYKIHATSGRRLACPNMVHLTPRSLNCRYNAIYTLEEDGHASRDSFGMQLFLEPLRTARR